MQKFLKTGAIVLFDESLRRYFTSFKSSFGIAVLLKDEVYLFCDSRYLTAAKQKARAKVIPYTDTALLQFLKEKGVKRVGLVYSHTTVFELETIKDRFEVCDASQQVFEAIQIKSKSQQNKIKKACGVAVKALRASLPHLKENILEIEFAKVLENKMLGFGAQDKAFETIVAFGKNSAIPHHQSGKTKLKENMAVLVDFGAKVDGFLSDMTRTFYFGTSNLDFRVAYKSVLNAHIKAARAIKVNSPAKDIDKIARDELKKDGLDKYFTHSLGHGLGFEIHEPPRLGINSNDVLKVASVFTVEPGVYIPNKFGIRIEDTYLLEEKGTKSLISFTKQIYNCRSYL